MPYISEIAFRSVKFNRKILPPQHIVVNLFSDYPFQKNSTCIKLASHIPRHYARLGNVILTFLEGFEIPGILASPASEDASNNRIFDTILILFVIQNLPQFL